MRRGRRLENNPQGRQIMTQFLKTTAMLLPLAIPGLLGACVSQSDYDKVVAENNQLKSQNQQQQQQLAAAATHTNTLRGAIAYEVNSDLLFRSGSWELSNDGKEVIGRMAQKLAPTQQVPLVVNGYTDNAPIGEALKKQGVTTNDELSQKRAEAVMQAMIAGGVKSDMVTAQGHGEADPVANNDSKQGRAANRRVEITYSSGTPAS
jgi:chemotaxis protein MotB